MEQIKMLSDYIRSLFEQINDSFGYSGKERSKEKDNS